MSDKNKFSKREWLLVIGLIIVVQFIIQMSAWIYSTNESVLNYISFTGTIVSIILALLAIIYAFVQSFTQKNSSQKLRSQIDQLMGVVNNIQTSEVELNNVLDRIKKISNKVDSSIEKQELIKSSLDHLKNRINFFNEESFIKKSDEIKRRTSKPEGIHSKIIAEATDGLIFNLLIFYHGYLKGYSVREIIDSIQEEIVEPLIVEDDHERTAISIEGSQIAIATILRILDLVSYKDFDSSIDLDEKFEKELESFISFLEQEYDEEDLLNSTFNLLFNSQSTEI